MAKPQRLDYMRNVVLPKAAAVFQEHDPEAFADFSCGTCHGDKRNGFRMPAHLPPLTDQLLTEKASEAAFMNEKVVPLMTALLGSTVFDCVNCHLPVGR